MKILFYLAITLLFSAPLSAVTPQEERIAAFCKAYKLVKKPTPTDSAIVQAIDAEQAAEQEEIESQEIPAQKQDTAPTNSFQSYLAE